MKSFAAGTLSGPDAFGDCQIVTSGPENTFEAVALPHLDAVYRAALAISGRHQEAEDLAQTAMLKAMLNFGSFRPGTNCKAWLLQIVRNAWIDRLRRQRPDGAALAVNEDLLAEPESEAPPPWTGAGDLLENFSDAEVISALQELGDDQRLALYLVDVEQMSLADVAALLEVAVGTVKSRTGRARAMLKQKLAPHARRMGFVGRRS